MSMAGMLYTRNNCVWPYLASLALYWVGVQMAWYLSTVMDRVVKMVQDSEVWYMLCKMVEPTLSQGIW